MRDLWAEEMANVLTRVTGVAGLINVSEMDMLSNVALFQPCFDFLIQKISSFYNEIKVCKSTVILASLVRV